jgi:hypothetical protein
MKYKVTVNEVVMIEGCSAIKALNMVCGVMQCSDSGHVRVYYWSASGECWKLENSFRFGEVR